MSARDGVRVLRRASLGLVAAWLSLPAPSEAAPERLTRLSRGLPSVMAPWPPPRPSPAVHPPADIVVTARLPDFPTFDPMAPEAYLPMPLPPPRPRELGPEAGVAAAAATESAGGSACRGAIDALGVRYQPLPPIAEGICGAPDPIRLIELPGGVKVPAGIVTVCPVALALARWTQDVVAPQAAALLKTTLARLDIGTSYQCRSRNHVPGAPLSEHGLANAVDLAGYAFTSGKPILVGAPRDAAAPEKLFEIAAHQGSCAYFTTVLGPGSNAAHSTHLHLDTKVRRGGYRLCQ